MIGFLLVGVIMLLMYLNHVDGLVRHVDEQIEKYGKRFRGKDDEH